MSADVEPDWKLELRYGKRSTPFQHRTVLADGVAGELDDGFQCPPGRAWMAMKAWSSDADEAAEMIRVIGQQVGFTVDGEVLVYDTEAENPPRDKPYAYEIRFVPYDD